MEQEIEIDVMIADASHEVYVDTILDTIESAAKVRGTGIAKTYARVCGPEDERGQSGDRLGGKRVRRV